MPRLQRKGFGSPDEMHVQKFNEKGSKFRCVPFAQPGERYSSILGGHADVLVEQAGDIKNFLESKQMRPVLFYAEKPQVGYESTPLASKYGVTLAISQFRSIVVRAGTDAAVVKALSAAIDKVAKSDDFRKYLAEELAFADSYIPADKSAAFIAGELATIEANTPKNAGWYSTRSASFPTSTEPTSPSNPCAVAGQIVYFAT